MTTFSIQNTEYTNTTAFPIKNSDYLISFGARYFYEDEYVWKHVAQEVSVTNATTRIQSIVCELADDVTENDFPLRGAQLLEIGPVTVEYLGPTHTSRPRFSPPNYVHSFETATPPPAPRRRRAIPL